MPHWNEPLRPGARCGITVMLCALAANAQAQISRAPQNDMASSRSMQEMSTPERRAADACARGVRLRHRGDRENDASKRQALYLRAQGEFLKSVQEQPTFDALLELGRVDLALEDRRGALDACARALQLKPGDASAISCRTQAETPAATPATPAPGATAGTGAAPHPADPGKGSNVTPPRADSPAGAREKTAGPQSTVPPPG